MNDDPRKKGNESKLEQMKEGLYSRSNPTSGYQKGELSDDEESVPTDWGSEDDDTTPMKQTKKKKGSFLNQLLIISIVFFLVAIAYAYFALNIGFNTVSPDNIDIQVTGPAEIASGEEVRFVVTIHNRNDAELTEGSLFVEYPAGTRKPTDATDPLRRTNHPLSSISPGGEEEKEIRAIFYGEEGEQKSLILSLDFAVSNSNAVFSKERTYDFEITSAPVSVDVDAPSEASSGQEVELAVRVRANSTESLSDVLLRAEYPFGFQFVGASEDPDFDTTAWELGTLEPSEEKEIRVRGILQGQSNDEKIFRFAVGTQEAGEGVFSTPFLTYEETIVLRRPFLGLSLDVGQDTNEGTTIVGAGEEIEAVLGWKNNTPTRISDAVITADIGGDIVDYASATVDNGLYRSSDGTIVWNQRTVSRLSLLDSEESGSYAFSFEQRPASEMGGRIENPTVTIDVTMEGKTLSDQGGAESVRSHLTKTIRVATNLLFGGETFYGQGPFDNTGPVPPQREQRTTYTVRLSVGTSYNDLEEVVVTGRLPQNVEWLSNTSPQDENIVFDDVTGEIVWNAGEVYAGAGYAGRARDEVFFQVALTPTLSQVNSVAELVNDVSVTATDVFVNDQITANLGQITTRLSSEGGSGIVQ